MNTPWREWPIAKLVIPYIAGIGYALYTHPWQPWSITAFVLVAGIFIALVLWQATHTSLMWQRVVSAAGMLAMGIAGIAAVHLHTDTHRSHHYSHSLSEADSLYVVIQQPPEETNKSFRLQVRVDTLYARGADHPVTGQCLLYIPKDSAGSHLSYGTALMIPALLQPIPPPGNPAAFDYRQYLSYRSIYHQAYLPDSLYRIIRQAQGSPLYRSVYKARSYLLQALETTMTDHDALAVASALLVGYKDLLGDDITQAYATTGAMHVLAVSGLHVGILFAVLQWLLRWLPTSIRSMRWIRPALLLLGIWSFALVTGLSASVVRAATMFSFIIIGQQMRRPVSIYSSVATSALLLLIINPYLLTEVGFQLSYSAVLGIVYLQPKLVRLVYVRYRVLQWLWEISCVSIAAQLATFPIGVYYFQQFPSYFLVSNLFVIPAAAVVLYAGLLLFVTSWIPVAAASIGLLLNEFIQLLNRIILSIESFPMAQIQTGSAALYQIVILYGILGMGTYWLVTLRSKGLFFTLLLLLTLTISAGYEQISRQSQQITAVYQVKGHTAIGCMDGTSGWLLADSLLIADTDKTGYQILPHFANAKCRIDTLVAITGSTTPLAGWQWQQGNSRWQLITAIPDTLRRTVVDYLVLRSNREITPRQLGTAYSFKQLVLDSSHSKRSQAFWEEVASDSGWSVHNVATMGAFVKESGH